MHSSEQYLNHYLKESWGFEGFAVTDWNDIEKLVYFHHVAADNKEVPPNRMQRSTCCCRTGLPL